MRKVLFGLLSVVAFALLFPLVSRAGNVSITLNPGLLTVTEGSMITLVYTVTNNTGAMIFGAGGNFGISGNIQFSSGDSDDGLLLADVLGSCSTLGSLGLGASCTIAVTYTGGSTMGEMENSDFGITQVSSGLTYVCPNCSGDTDRSITTMGQTLFLPSSSNSFVTVTDPTPEPSSLLLLGTGLLGLGPFIRRFPRR